ncbi:hypothetical protein [Qipengyuania flava]|uniref:hypothetical protein n=1 Tax=Qipengyuania flava TaxID=192812 RepID=UPI00141B20AE|nr:hypothetical protein [Qipengyuania flava]NIJ61149.1 hypothetical protein [Qipengyuania flava]
MSPYIDPRGRKNNYERGPAIAAARERYRKGFPDWTKLIDEVAAAEISADKAMHDFADALEKMEVRKDDGSLPSTRQGSLAERRLAAADDYSCLRALHRSLEEARNEVDQALRELDTHMEEVRHKLFELTLEQEPVPDYVRRFVEKCQEEGMTAIQGRAINREHIRKLLNEIGKKGL